MPAHATRRAKSVVIADRRTQMIQMRLDGKPFEEIAQTLGYSSRHAASKDFSRALEQNLAEQRTSMEVYRETELLRLDGELERLTLLYAKVERILDGFHVTVQFGKVITIEGEPLEDTGPVLAAVDRLIKIEDARRRNGERRAKLMGLEAAQKFEVLTLDAIDQQIALLNEQLTASGSEAGEAEGAEATSD